MSSLLILGLLLMERMAGGTADELMEPHFMHARPEEELEDVLQRLLEHEIEDLGVIDDLGALAGAINLTQVLRGMREQTL
jgi:CBS domain-containing protein